MGKRIYLIVIVLGLFGWLGLTAIQWQFGLGRFAVSPQKILLQPGRRAIVGGGRAVLGMIANQRRSVTVEIRCAEESRRLELAPEVPSEEVCSVRVRYSEVADPLRALPGTVRFEISWSEEGTGP